MIPGGSPAPLLKGPRPLFWVPGEDFCPGDPWKLNTALPIPLGSLPVGSFPLALFPLGPFPLGPFP